MRDIERRIAALETDVRELRRQVPVRRPRSAAAGSGGAGGVMGELCKVTAIWPRAELVEVHPLLADVDPRDLVAWNDAASFDASRAQVVWSGGFTLIQVGWPVVVFRPGNLQMATVVAFIQWHKDFPAVGTLDADFKAIEPSFEQIGPADETATEFPPDNSLPAGFVDPYGA